jgi:hypothetical protein
MGAALDFKSSAPSAVHAFGGVGDKRVILQDQRPDTEELLLGCRRT